MEQMNARAATNADIGLVHRELMDLIDSMPFYSDLFKTHEKARFTKTFLRTLIAVDPWHVLLLEMDGEVGGFLISGPDCGTIFQYWSAIFPKFRKTRWADLAWKRSSNTGTIPVSQSLDLCPPRQPRSVLSAATNTNRSPSSNSTSSGRIT